MNLALLCWRHHRAVHQDGFQVTRRPDGELEFRDRNGWVLPQVPASPKLTGNSEEVLRGANDAAGVKVDSTTLKSDWDGTRLNLGWAIDVMHPRAIGH